MQPSLDQAASARLVFTPKQVAHALGVSESSVKRWVDSGKLRATKTLGGHRKISINAVSRFVRESGQEVPRPEVLGLTAAPLRCEPAEYVDLLFRRLIAGDGEAVRRLIVGMYQGGVSIPALGDQLLSPAMRRVGERWSEGSVSIHQERQGTLAITAALHEVRLMLPPPPRQGRLAVCATPAPDFAEAPLRLVEMTLLASGWRVVVAGPSLPLSAILGAIQQHRPDLVCLSATHLADPCVFVQGLREQVATGLYDSTDLVVGGAALEDLNGELPSVIRMLPRLSDLQAYLQRKDSDKPAMPERAGAHAPQGIGAAHLHSYAAPATVL